MALSWRNNADSIRTTDGELPSRSANAFERGAARRRSKPGVIRRPSPVVAAPRREPPARLQLSPPAPRQEHGAATETIVVVDPVWRARVETDLMAVHGAVARLDADRASDAHALRAAVAQWEGGNSPDRWAEQLGRIQDQLDTLEQAIQAGAERAAVTEPRPDRAVAQTRFDSDQVEALSRAVSELREQQREITATLGLVSESLAAERLRTTVMILAGTAIGLMSAALWLMTNTLVS